MKLITASIACVPLLTISVQATEPDLKFGDLIIDRGMSVDALRSQLSDSQRLTCRKPESGMDTIPCTLSALPVHLVVQNGHVLAASQTALPPSGYDTLLTLYNHLSQLTHGHDTCAVVRVSPGPPPQFAIALPEKVIGVYLHDQFDQRHVTMNVGLRQNPSPDIGLEDCWPESRGADQAPANNAMQRSALVARRLQGQITARTGID